MDSQKLDNELQLALSLPENVREESLDLDVGYNATEERWTLIVRYIGDIEAAAGAMAEITLLLGGYAIVRIREKEIEALSALPQVIYVEKPRQLQFAVRRGKISSCFLPVQSVPYELYGKFAVNTAEMKNRIHCEKGHFTHLLSSTLLCDYDYSLFQLEKQCILTIFFIFIFVKYKKTVNFFTASKHMVYNEQYTGNSVYMIRFVTDISFCHSADNEK